MKWRSSFTLY